MKLTRMVQEWLLDEMDNGPAHDPNHTPQCLGFGEIENAARRPENASAQQLAHIVECAWCRRNWLTFKNLASAAPEAPAQSVPAPATISSASWTSGEAQRISQYLTSATYLARENNAPVPARFDSEGTLHVSWSGLAQEGPVSVSLFVDGIAQYLVSGIVSNGSLEIIEPLANLGQRDVELPASVLLLQPVVEGQM